MPFPGLLFLLSAVPGTADATSDAAKGAALLHGCQAEIRLMDAGAALAQAEAADLINGSYCIGYLNGFLTGIHPGAGGVCLGNGNMSDLVRAYVRFMERNPQFAEEDKRIGLRLALQDAFPCPVDDKSASISPATPPAVPRPPAAASGHILGRSRRYV